MAEEIEIRKKIEKDDVYVSRTDTIILLMKMKNSSLSLTCRQTLQNAIDVLTDAA